MINNIEKNIKPGYRYKATDNPDNIQLNIKM